ncbi:MAG: SH3 domain-containing protein [Mesorhizobium sp.]|nr:SH3 domain-containing protein [Mesorhizobium sp.]RVD67808.1 SH3 domain-containing protein [Mesorhizobium sp. M4A.F.Ca.ET.029.04.2.1]RWD08026.1 MAG: SH3 domain-containing protein [Mesorhizobium sp.]TIW31967.1 MAG: SH3 domain-containing protein [Mesorhizobium sp.]
MRRTDTPGTMLVALAGALFLATALPARAEDPSTTIVSIVTGLAPDDLLNIRVTASATGRVQGRLPGGASVKNFGCNEVNGNPWCKVEEVDNPQVKGWAPARYLTPGNPAIVADMPTEDPSPAAGTTDAPAAPAPPPDLTARFGEVDQGAPKSAAAIGRTAMEDAYGLAFAASENPSTGEIPGETATVARLEPPQAPGDAGTGIPCARYVGQPMTLCKARIEHKGADKADVTVTWPDGGTRLISFYGGLPAGSDSPDEFRFTREGSLNMIRVGVSERFEITDQLALGN